MAYSATLQAELQGNPLGRDYSTDPIATADLNSFYRDGAADGNLLVQYTLTNLHRANTGTDTERLTIWGRLDLVAKAQPGDDVFGQTPQHLATKTDIAAAKTLLRLLGTDVQTLITNINDTRYAQLLDALVVADVMSVQQADDMKSLSENKSTRAQELSRQPGSDCPARVREADVRDSR